MNFTRNLKPHVGVRLWLWILILGVVPLGVVVNSGAENIEDLSALIGNKDSILVADARGKILFAKNENTKLVPASILKLFTSMVALHYLGPSYRFSTEFYLDGESNLKIKGYGDPLLISEAVKKISRHLVAKLGTSDKLTDLILDSSYFSQPLVIPGITSSPEPYDAPNGALCVNFNTVYFKRTKNGYISAEPQTPLLPFAIKKIKSSKLNQGRIVFSHKEDEITIYAGKIFQYFLKQNGIDFSGSINIGKVDPQTDRLILRYVSTFSLEQIISKLLEYSNNFTTNQLLITCGIKAHGTPGTLTKGVAAALSYAREVLNLEGLTIVEGSGISRRNRINASHMHKILDRFAPYRHLMLRENNEFYKTGTLRGINTRAGYIQNKNGALYRYVVMINTPGKSAQPVIEGLLRIIDEH
jgi:D-alanyl-D-alanine carboxypeptidase/D-alanyl-D-alanine-endopeptidase (penicillin-binding protein 4)